MNVTQGISSGSAWRAGPLSFWKRSRTGERDDAERRDIMIVVLKNKVEEEQKRQLIEWLEGQGAHPVRGGDVAPQGTCCSGQGAGRLSEGAPG